MPVCFCFLVHVVACLQLLLKEGADVNAVNYERDTPLHITASEGELKLSKASQR